MGGRRKQPRSRTPVEAKETGRSFQILRILEVISEGEIYGLVDDMRSIYLDKTPICNPDNTFNFKNISISATSGQQDQEVLPEFNSVEKEVKVGSKILYTKPIIKTVTNENINRVRLTLGVERLVRTENNGDTNPSSVTFNVDILKDNQIWANRQFTISGKYSNPYREMIMLPSLPPVPFQIRVGRTDRESTSNRLQNSMFWGSYTEIVDQEFTYPNTAVVGIKIDSEYFNNVPTRNYEVYGLIMKVPDIYNAFDHTYSSDFWSGEFKLSWTNNPAWVLYDLITNTRYGMGMRLADFGVDKWQLYAIGKYCDELVPDGFGSTEPRMTCNAWITSQRKAYDLIMDLCSIFRGMPVWNGQALSAIQDRVADPVWTYNNSNVIGGFKRQRSARKARHNTIQVEYIDKNDFYDKKIESVSDDRSIARYGENVKKITAFGCTSRGQAYRTARWILETERLETETVTFTVGQEGLMHLPYDIIQIADNEYAGLNIGGRILNIQGANVTLDREIEIDDKSYLSYISTNAKPTNVKILDFDPETKVATVAKDMTGVAVYSVWGLVTKRITTGLYRAISIKENDSSNSKTYTITALQHVPEKEDIVTNGTYFEPKPQTIHGQLTDITIGYDGKNVAVTGIMGEQNNGLLSNTIDNYTVRLSKNTRLVYIKKGLPTPDLQLEDLDNGEYEVVISAYNKEGQLLSSYTKTFTIDRPPLISNVKIEKNLGSVWLTWENNDTSLVTEIWVSKTDDITSAELQATVSANNYIHRIGGSQTRFYWFRHKRGGVLGLFDQIQGREITTDKDIDERLDELNDKLQDNIVNEIIDVALPARNLEMTKTVENLTDVNTYLGHNQVYNKTDGKLYIWNGSKYETGTNKILASAIEGIIDMEQLAPIPTTKLEGMIKAEQLEVNSVGTNALQAGAITTDKIGANQITSANISTAAIRSEHLASSQVTADKIAVGLNGNLLNNPILANEAYGWSKYASSTNNTPLLYEFRNRTTGAKWHPQDTLENENVIKMRIRADDNINFGFADPIYQTVRLVPYKWYIFSCYAQLYRTNGKLLVEKYNNDGTSYIGEIGSQSNPMNDGSASSAIGNMSRYFIKFQAPDTGWVRLGFRCYGNTLGNNPDCYIARPMLEECIETTVVPNSWQNSGVTSIHGGSIRTRTITTEQIQAGAITSNEIAVNAVQANNVQAGAITADKVNIANLSAISSDFGEIRAGSVKIGSRNNLGHGTLFEIKSTGGFILSSRTATGGVEFSSEKNALIIWRGNVISGVFGKIKGNI